MNFQSVRMHQPVASVTNDGDFAYVQVGCGHVTRKREGNRIVLIAGPDCQLAASGGPDTVTVTVAVSSKKDEKTKSNQPDEGDLLRDEVSDEAVEAAASVDGRASNSLV